MTWKELDPLALALYNQEHPAEPIRLHEWKYVDTEIKTKYRKRAKERANG